MPLTADPSPLSAGARGEEDCSSPLIGGARGKKNKEDIECVIEWLISKWRLLRPNR